MVLLPAALSSFAGGVALPGFNSGKLRAGGKSYRVDICVFFVRGDLKPLILRKYAPAISGQVSEGRDVQTPERIEIFKADCRGSVRGKVCPEFSTIHTT